MPLSDKVKSIPQTVSDAPVWAGPGGAGVNGGVTQSMLGRYLSCRERFRISVIEGLKPIDKFQPNMEFGNMWHVCEEALAANQSYDKPLHEYCKKLCDKYRSSQNDIDHWYQMTKALFPVYADYWAKQAIRNKRKPLLQEKAFDVEYALSSGRNIRLRGKWDSVDEENQEIWIMENKTKSQIDSQKLTRQLTMDLQVMVYLTALNEYKTSTSNPRTKVWGKLPVVGVRYNVIRRSAHATPESMLNKIGLDMRNSRVDEWFSRWEVRVTNNDIQNFKTRCLNPVLENLLDDYEWWAYCKKNNGIVWDSDVRHRVFPHHQSRQYVFPYGIWNPIAEGGFGDLDNYLSTGSTVGLRVVDNLFPELQ